MAAGQLQTPRSSFSVGALPSQLLVRFESLSGAAAGAIIAGLLASTVAFPHLGALEPLVLLWLFVPVVLAAIRFRSMGALVTAAIALALAGPLVPWHHGPLAGNAVAEWIGASLAFVAMGQFVAVAVHQRRGARGEVVESIRAKRLVLRALAARRFEVHYQPIVAITGPHDYIASAEALLRWRDPAPYDEAPAALLEAAERGDVMQDLSDFVLNQACEHIAGWSGLFPRPFVVSVNLSASELADDTLPGRIVEAVTRNHIDPRQLGLEITETAVMDDVRHSIELLQQIHDLGVRIAIDDFGTGQSSLEYIRLLPVDIIKIDGSFIEGLPDDPVSATLVSSVVDLAHALGLQIIGEQVETEKQLATLRDMGCDYAQGFHFNPAVAPEDVTDWLHGRQGQLNAAPRQAPSRALPEAHRQRPRRRARRGRAPTRGSGAAAA